MADASTLRLYNYALALLVLALTALVWLLLRWRRFANRKLVVRSVHVYPLKSCGALELPGDGAAAVDWLGFVMDREWMVVDAETLEMVSQRLIPRMATIKPALLGGRSKRGGGDALELELTAPGMDAPLVLTTKHAKRSKTNRVVVKVWDDEINAVDVGDDAAYWMTTFLGREVRLVRSLAREEHCRPLPVKWVGDAGLAGKDDDPVQARFQDGYPFLLTTHSSLRELNRRLAQAGDAAVPMARFRANIVVSGDVLDAFEEDGWDTITIGDMPFKIVKPCSRCVLPTTDQVTGKRDSSLQPLKMLRRFRQMREECYFGQNILPASELHDALRVGGPALRIVPGDPVKVVKWRARPNVNVTTN